METNDEDVFAFTLSQKELIVLNRALNFWLVTLGTDRNEQAARKATDVLRRVDEALGVAQTMEKRKKERELRKIGDLPNA